MTGVNHSRDIVSRGMINLETRIPRTFIRGHIVSGRPVTPPRIPVIPRLSPLRRMKWITLLLGLLLVTLAVDDVSAKVNRQERVVQDLNISFFSYAKKIAFSQFHALLSSKKFRDKCARCKI